MNYININIMADSKLRAMGLARGREGTEHRRVLSTANSACLLDGVARVGEGQRQAAKRRAWAKREEERLRQKRKTYWHVNIRAKGVSSRGEFFA